MRIEKKDGIAVSKKPEEGSFLFGFSLRYLAHRLAVVSLVVCIILSMWTWTMGLW